MYPIQQYLISGNKGFCWKMSYINKGPLLNNNCCSTTFYFKLRSLSNNLFCKPFFQPINISFQTSFPDEQHLPSNNIFYSTTFVIEQSLLSTIFPHLTMLLFNVLFCQYWLFMNRLVLYSGIENACKLQSYIIQFIICGIYWKHNLIWSRLVMLLGWYSERYLVKALIYLQSYTFW